MVYCMSKAVNTENDVVQQLTIAGLPPRQFSPLLQSHGWRFLLPFEPLDKGFRYTFNLRENTAVTVDVVVEKGGLVCRADRALGPTDRTRLEACLARMLALDFPMAAFRARCKARGEEAYLRLAQKGWGRVLRAATPREDAVKILCTTNVAWTNTVRMVANLVGAAGRTSASGRRPFPTPEDVLKAARHKNAPALKLGYRLESLVILARSALGENAWLMEPTPPNLPEDALFKRIQGFRGFGPYAAQHLMIMMNYYGYLPIDSEVAKFLQADGRVHPGEPFEDWGEFRFPAYLLATKLR